MAHYIVFSHGFGVRKDARGMFTELAAALPDASPVLFDYNLIDPDQKALTVQPIGKQVEILQSQLAAMPADSTIDIIAHSQGCIITALARPQGVRRILLLAPPERLAFEKMVGIFGKHPDSVINPTGETRLAQSDGSTTIVPANYWQSLPKDLPPLYNALADVAKVIIVRAAQDNVVGQSDFSHLDKRITILTIPGDHSFSAADRPQLIDTVTKLLG